MASQAAQQQTVLGLEIGTRFIKVARFIGDANTGRGELVVTRNGERETPCFFALSSSKEPLFGESAYQHAPRNERTTAYDLLRFIGLPHAHEQTRKGASAVRFPLSDGGARGTCFRLAHESEVTPTEALVANLKSVKAEMEDAVGTGQLGGVAVTLSPTLLPEQRSAVLAAVTQAGLQPRSCLDTPVAAALAAGLDQRPEGAVGEVRQVLVVEIGVEFRATLLRVYGTGLISTVCTEQSPVGGDQIDELVLRHLTDDFQRKERCKMEDAPRSIARLRRAAEQAKRTLSQTIQTNIDVESLYEGSDYNSQLNRGRFDLLCSQMYQKWQEPITRLLNTAQLAPTHLSGYLLTGGCSSIPAIRSFFESLFPSVPLIPAPPEAAALGASLQGLLCQEHRSLFAPVDSSSTSSTTTVKVAPRTVAVEGGDGSLLVLVRQGQPVPVSVIHDFATSVDDQVAVVLRLVDEQKNLLGRVVVDQLPPQPKGSVFIKTTLRLDESGDLQVIATAFDSSRTPIKTVTFVV